MLKSSSAVNRTADCEPLQYQTNELKKKENNAIGKN